MTCALTVKTYVFLSAEVVRIHDANHTSQIDQSGQHIFVKNGRMRKVSTFPPKCECRL